MRFLRYPGGKKKLLEFIAQYLPNDISGNYVDPFVGGGALFWYLKPQKSLLSDLNQDLIDLYKGIRHYPHKVWEIFKSFSEGKEAYYKIREEDINDKRIWYRAARILYLNRTCFKGMWRHNANGKFNVGYGGEARRWVITYQNIIKLSNILKSTTILRSDFSITLDQVVNGDFIFLDPPYRPGEKEMLHAHYINGKFTYHEQLRLAEKIIDLSNKNDIKWMMTNSDHPEILQLYKSFNIIKIPKGTSSTVGVLTSISKEVLITNY